MSNSVLDEFRERAEKAEDEIKRLKQRISMLESRLDAQEAQDDGSNEWEAIIGDRTSDTMKQETAVKFDLDKKNSNAYKRLQYVQTLFATDQKSEEKKTEKKEEKHGDHFFKPIDDVLDITRGASKPIGDNIGIYAISSEADMSLDCKFSVTGSGRHYYEVELVHDPNTYKNINVGFANSSHSARNEVGNDADSYGYNGVKNKIFNMDTKYGATKWKIGDVIGFALDGTNIEYYLNGVSQGIAFEEVDCVGDLYAGFTLKQGQNGVFIFDESKLKQSKPDGYSCLTVDSDAKSEDVWTLNGDITCENVENGIKITAVRGFPTATLKSCALSKDKKYYFEFELGTAGCMQLGFADEKFEANAARGQGIGDDSHSWGCDFMRMQKWGIFGSAYGNVNWAKGDIIGCLLDFETKCISFSVNGKDCGVAFTDIDCSQELYPCVSIRNIEARNKMIAAYQQMRAGAAEGEVEMPESITYFNLLFCDAGYKYKPNLLKDCRAMTDNIAFKAMDICNGLKEYSYEQYKDDYAFMDTVIMLAKDEEFDEICKKVGKDTLVVCDFWASWCGPCVYIAPIYHKMSEEFPSVVFLKADVDKLKKLSQEKEINCMPTFKFFKDGKEVHKIEGADKDSIVEAVKKYSQ